MDYTTEIVTSLSRFQEITENAPTRVVADVETKGELDVAGILLGIALAFRRANSPNVITSLYVPFYEYDLLTQNLTPADATGMLGGVTSFLQGRELIGHQVEYDRMWIDAKFGLSTKWHADTRKMWHLSDDTDAKHGFGLKMAQTELLGWAETNAAALEKEVEERGGKLSNGDHYLASSDTLAYYACLDVVSTLQLYERLVPFFEKNDYWTFLQWRQDYHQILTEATRTGMRVDVSALLDAKETLTVKCENSEKEIRKTCPKEIEALEECWAEEKALAYKTEKFANAHRQDKEKWRKFNPNSGDQRSQLLYGMLGLPVKGTTPTGKPKSDRDTIASLNHPAARAFVTLSEDRKILQFTEGYLESLRAHTDGTYTIHFPYNTSATVSDRLGGFKPYCLNMPFSEESVMKAFQLPEGYVGIHADLAAIEPCLIAAYSEDPTLLKVHRDGLGDVYLDLALSVFPENEALKLFYDPMKPCSAEIKKKFKDIRAMCKIVHLAVGYTGTAFTIHRNLNKVGHEISLDDAAYLVNKYWEKFDLVAKFNSKLKALHNKQGYLRNILGRIIRVPKRYEKDTMNRFIQSGGHDCLTAWVMGIDERRRAMQHIGMFPVLVDLHDATGWAVKEEYYDEARRIFDLSLAELNDRLKLPVTLKVETKKYRTLHGLKGDEE
jgi:DNA polymerase I-like protein with 3'-5' exonuclease and polymerase domains